MISYLAKAFSIPQIRNKILFTLGILAFYRFLAHVPVPSADTEALKTFFEANQALNLVNAFLGGGLSNLSIVAVGLGPYISASIVIQILTQIVPKLEELAKEGSFGRQRINQYTQFLTLPLALLQSYGLYLVMSRQNASGVSLLTIDQPLDLIVMIISMAAGAFLLIFLGQLITERGIGQGVSVLIFASILSGLPSAAGNFVTTADAGQIINVLIFIGVSLGVIASVVYINEAYRRVDIQYSGRSSAGQTSGGKSYIPIKINQAGVIPIIFAVSLTLVPTFMAGWMQQSSNPTIVEIGTWLGINFQPTTLLYNLFYFTLVFGFTYFYTSITFNPEKIAEDIRKSGGFIPGIRPGKATVNYLGYLINRLTLAGGVFLGLIAIMPSVMQGITGVSSLAMGGTGILIVVSVVLETVKQIEAQVISREYQSITS